MIAGVDLSSFAIDVALLDDELDVARWFRCRLDSASSFDRARKVRDLMPARGAWLDEGVVAIGIEDPYSKGMKTVKAMARVEGALLAVIPPEIPIYKIAPSGWMKRFVGKGNASKAEIRATGLPFFADPPRHQDAFDACGVAFAARQIHDETTTRRRAA